MTDKNKPDNEMSRWLKGLRKAETKSLETLRGWSLTALYFTLAFWAIIFCYVAYSFWDYMLEQSGGSALMSSLLMSTSVTTFLLSARAGNMFLKAMRLKERLPAVDLLPFLSIAVTIVIAGQALGTA